MADVFISYAREDRALVKRLAQELNDRHYSVWCDVGILPGADFSKHIAAELTAAKAIIVLWTPHSIQSNWVRDEAQEGLKRGILVPVLIDVLEQPMGYRAIHAVDLTDWNEAAMADLIHAIDRLIKPSSFTTQTIETSVMAQLGSSRVNLAQVIAAAVLLLLLGAGLASIHGLMQTALDSLDEIKASGLPNIQTKVDDTNRRLDIEITRSREYDLENLNRIRALESNLRRLIAYAEKRSEDVEEILQRVDPNMAREFHRLRERDKVILPNLMPPQERGESGEP